MSGPDIGQAHLFTPPPATTLTLAEKFLVPPFSVLDAKAGYWKERKRDWLNIGIEPELGSDRGDALMADDQGLRSGEGRGEHLLNFSAAAEGISTYADRRKAEEAERLQAEVQAAAGGGLESGEGRGDRLLSKATPREGFGGDYDLAKGENAWGGAGTSIFDPVLCELSYRWFTPRGGHILDPFAGGSVRGIVAAAMERHYLGVDLRAEQVAANEAQAERIGAGRGWADAGVMPQWVTGDGRDVGGIAGDRRFDFLFSCPPYYDLEVYSDDPRDLSKAASYDEFRAAYFEIIFNSCRLLKDNRFAAFVVGEVRGKDGNYVGLVPDTISSFKAAGLAHYNEAILLTAIGSLPIRASRTFGPGRKLGKTHQNLLVFVKGDAKQAAKDCGTALEVALEQGGAVWSADGSVEVPETGERRAFAGEEPGA